MKYASIRQYRPICVIWCAHAKDNERVVVDRPPPSEVRLQIIRSSSDKVSSPNINPFAHSLDDFVVYYYTEEPIFYLPVSQSACQG